MKRQIFPIIIDDSSLKQLPNGDIRVNYKATPERVLIKGKVHMELVPDYEKETITKKLYIGEKKPLITNSAITGRRY